MTDLDQIDAMLIELGMAHHKQDVMSLVKETGIEVLTILKVFYREGKRQGIMETTEMHNKHLCRMTGRLGATRS